jgi:hypothetical protein
MKLKILISLLIIVAITIICCSNANNKQTLDDNPVVYTTYPTLDSIKSKDLKEFIIKIDKLNLKDTDENAYNYTPEIPKSILKQLIFKNFDKIFEKNYYLNSKYFIDSTEIIYEAVGQLPTNGNFIMLLIQTHFEHDLDIYPHFYILTLNLYGEFISSYHCYSDNFFYKNNKKIESIKGYAFNLNTNKPYNRMVYYYVATLCESYYNKEKMKNECKYEQEIEIIERHYLIDDTGKIYLNFKKDIFPKKNVKWTTPYEDFSSISDTIKSILLNGRM